MRRDGTYHKGREGALGGWRGGIDAAAVGAAVVAVEHSAGALRHVHRCGSGPRYARRCSS